MNRTIIFKYNQLQEVLLSSTVISMKKKVTSLLLSVMLLPAIVIATTLIISNKPIDKNNPEIYYLTGNAFAVRDEYKLAVEQYEKAIFLNPNHEKAMNNLAFMYNKLGEYEKAASMLERLIELQPNDPSYHYDYAINLVLNIKKKGEGKIEEIEKAIEELKKAEELEPGYLEAKKNIAFLEELRNQYYEKTSTISINQSSY